MPITSLPETKYAKSGDISIANGVCQSTVCGTKDCDGQDICGNACDGDTIKRYQDYYVQANSETSPFGERSGPG